MRLEVRADLDEDAERRERDRVRVAVGVPGRSHVDRYMRHAYHSTPIRYRHQLDAQYLEDAQALGDYLRRADTPSRLAGARTGAHLPEGASLSEN
jgi:hypothetical protein